MGHFLSNIQTILKINVNIMRIDADIRIKLGKDDSYVGMSYKLDAYINFSVDSL